MEQVSSFFENILSVENEQGVLDGNAKRDPSSPLLMMNSPKHGDRHRRHLSHSGATSSQPQQVNNYIMDKLFERLVNMIIPVNDSLNNSVISERLEMQKTRPPLSMNVMSQNSVKMTSRLTNIFILIDNTIKCFSWHNPYLTVGVLLIATHLILNPYLVFALPIALVVIKIMIPHYLIIHPPDKSVLSTEPMPDDGPMLQPPKIPGPVPQFSQEFLLNFTDLQNHMMLYVNSYDFILWVTRDLLYFKNEDLSSVVMLGLILLMVLQVWGLPKLILIASNYVPLVKGMLIFMVWFTGIMIYPSNLEGTRSVIQLYMIENEEDEEKGYSNNLKQFQTKLINKLLVHEKLIDNMKMLEVFELQRFNRLNNTWDFIGFVNNSFPINHSLRKLNDNLFKDSEDDIELEDNIKLQRIGKITAITPPSGWEFIDDLPWVIDLTPLEWCGDQLIKDLVNIDDDEKWVYDYNDDGKAEMFRRRRWIRPVKRLRHKQIKQEMNI